MIKKLMLFKHIDICNNCFNDITDLLIDELKKRNIKYEIVDLNKDKESMEAELTSKLDDSFDAAISFNTMGQHNIQNCDGENLFDHYGVPFYNWILDNPVDLMNTWKSKCKNFYCLCMDKFHVEYIKRNFEHVKDTFFLPLGGVSRPEPLKSFNEREYDITFMGRIGSLNKIVQTINSLPDEQKTFIYNLIDYSMDNRSLDINAVSEAVLKERLGIEFIEEGNIEFVRCSASLANIFMREYNRLTVLKSIVDSKLNFHIFGGDREILGDGMGYTHYHDGVSFSETVNIFRNSKIVLNVMPCFKNGIHDRIPSGMLNKALVLTDGSIYINELLSDMVIVYDLEEAETLAEKLSEIISNIEKYQEMVERAYEYARLNFSWEKTTDRLLSILESCC